MATDSAQKSPTLATDELQFFESTASDKPETVSADDESKFFGKALLAPVAPTMTHANKAGSTNDLLVDFEGAKGNPVSLNADASGSSDVKNNVSLLDDTPLST